MVCVTAPASTDRRQVDKVIALMKNDPESVLSKYKPSSRVPAPALVGIELNPGPAVEEQPVDQALVPAQRSSDKVARAALRAIVIATQHVDRQIQIQYEHYMRQFPNSDFTLDIFRTIILGLPKADDDDREFHNHVFNDQLDIEGYLDCYTALVDGAYVPPQPRLVCVETNPGPTHNKPKLAKKLDKLISRKAGAAKQVVNSAVMKGRGDYRPTVFNKTKGRGDYFTDAGSKVGSHIGKALGKAGGSLVSSLLSPFTSILGMGDYRTNGPNINSLYDREPGTALPVSHPDQIAKRVGGNPNPLNMGANSVSFGGGHPRVTHREFIGPVLSGGANFATKVYPIQPGLRGVDVLFPWGSSVANCFQQYRLLGGIMEFKSTSTDYAATTVLGTVAMSTVYDAGASPDRKSVV